MADNKNQEHVNAQIAKLQGSMESFQGTVLDELRQIRFGLELKFPVFRCRVGVGDADPHPLDWLSRAERFFNFYKVPEDQKVSLASNHFQGHAALEWLILYERTTTVPIASWTHFVDQFLTHFGYGDINASLLRLKQQGGGGGGGGGGVDAYITDFIRLVSRASKNWTDNDLRGFFLNGLQDELRGEVRLYKPETLSAAMDLARVLEERPPPQEEQFFIPKLPRYEALFMGKTRVKVLMSGSSHNFISSSVLKGVDRRLIIKEDDPLLVKPLAGIGDEKMMTTEGRIDGAQVNLQGFQFAADFFLLPDLRWCDVMLGNPWQCSLPGYRVGLNEDSFMVNGKNFQLTAEKHPPGTITQYCCVSLWGIRKSKVSSQ